MPTTPAPRHVPATTPASAPVTTPATVPATVPATTPALKPVAVPARLSDGAADERIASANRIFADIVRLIEAAGLSVAIVSDASIDLGDYSALVLPGGGDVDPARYGGDSTAPVYDVNADQDALDFDLAERAIAADLPVFGICRGAQVLNVVYGGTLHEDLAPSHVVHAPAGQPDGFAWHDVTLREGSRIAETLPGSDSFAVASAHHQAVRDLGAGLTATATTADGLVEAFEDPERWVLAVQWHPEVEVEGSAAVVRDGQFRALADEVVRRARG